MRAFIAVDVNDEVKALVERVEDTLKVNGVRAKWVSKNNIHITLRFIGDMDDRDVKKLNEYLSPSISTLPAFEFVVGELGTFPSNQILHPRIIWLGVKEGKEQLIEIAREVNKTLSKVGYSLERTLDIPHVTVGRVKYVPKSEWWRGVEKREIKVKVTHVKLFSSTLTRSGPIYACKIVWPLKSV